MQPIFPIPNYITSIWGGHRLSEIRGVTPPPGKEYGICREVCAYKNAENRIGNLDFNGRNLRDLIAAHHRELLGDDPADQLVRVAYIDAEDDLSIQVHPDEDYAKRVENDYEKSESWYVLDCGPGAYVVAGTTTADKQLLRSSAEEGSIERYIRKVPVQDGDFIMIPAGMLHACGKHMLVIEAGSFGGITYRLHDYGRGRPLHLDRGFDVLDPAIQPLIRHFPLSGRPASGFRVQEAIRHPAFCADIVDIADEWCPEDNGICMTLTAVDGSSMLLSGGAQYPLDYTRTVLLPAQRETCTVAGACRLLRCWHPSCK